LRVPDIRKQTEQDRIQLPKGILKRERKIAAAQAAIADNLAGEEYYQQTIANKTYYKSLLPTKQTEYQQKQLWAEQFTLIDEINGVANGGGLLLRVNGTWDGKPVRIMIDTGATNDFVSLDWIERNGWTDKLTQTKRLIRGYDGKVVQAAGELQGELAIKIDGQDESITGKITSHRTLLAAQLYTDEIIVGMPWLIDNKAIIKFDPVTISVSTGTTPRTWCELPLIGYEGKEETEKHHVGLHRKILAKLNQIGWMVPESDYDWVHEMQAARGEDEREEAKMNDKKELERLQKVRDRERTTPILRALKEKMLNEFNDVFPKELPAGIPPGRGHELAIDLLPGSRPPNRVPPRQNVKHREFAEKWVKEMLGKKFIRPSSSEFMAPHFYVDKPETPTTGEYRAVTDYRLLNNITRKNKYPLPRVDELFDCLVGCKVFSKIDLRTGFYQIPIKEQDRHKTGFVTGSPPRAYEYNVLPMGLCNSPSVFMALMNAIFERKGILGKFVVVFLDDILIFSKSQAEHEEHLRQVMQCLRENRLFAKESKSELCKTEVEFLGHYVGQDGVRVMEDKIQAVKEWPAPTRIKELRAFLGLAGYYRRFVKGFSEIAQPLTELTRASVTTKLPWGKREQIAFDNLKQALCSTPILVLPDVNKPFVVNCDASGYAVGAVLQQDHGKGLQPVAYLSRKLTGAESRYPTHEQELYAIVEALSTWRHYLHGATHQVIIRTDHKSLQLFQTQPMMSGRQVRWMEILQNYNYKIEYVKGEDNIADGPSRYGAGTGGGPANEPQEKKLVVDPVGATSTVAAVQEQAEFQVNTIWKEPTLEIMQQIWNIQVQERVLGRQRREMAERERNRQWADRQAKEMIPEAEVDPNRPPLDKHGSRNMPSQRCTANSKKTELQCANKTLKGNYCAVHMRTMAGLKVSKSTNELAGMGLFAARDFEKGEHIADYTGDELIYKHDTDKNKEKLNNRGIYVLGLTRYHAVDGSRTNSGYGRWANDPRGMATGEANAELTNDVNYKRNMRAPAGLRAKRKINKGEEIFVNYGAEYWKNWEEMEAAAREELPFRPAIDEVRKKALEKQTHRARLQLERIMKQIDTVKKDIESKRQQRGKVIDLTTVSDAAGPVGTAVQFSGELMFSTDLAARFEEVCKGNALYQKILEQGSTRQYAIKGGRVFIRRTGALLVPGDQALRTALLRECHDTPLAGHLGRDKTLAQMQKRFWWHGMTADVAKYVETCVPCQSNKHSHQKTPGQLMPIPSPGLPGETWTLDLIGPLPVTEDGNDCIVVFVDKLTKLVHYAPTRMTIDAPGLARLFLVHIVRVHGMPASLITDRDPRFTANYWEAFWSLLGTTLKFSTAYHPQTDGQTENANKTLEQVLRAYVDFDQKNWDQHLAAAELAVNNSKNATTGFTPFYLFYGQEARLPIDLGIAPLLGEKNPQAVKDILEWKQSIRQALENTERAQAIQKSNADRSRRAVKFQVGDQVMLDNANYRAQGEEKRSRKLAEQWWGPYTIKRVVSDNAYELDVSNSRLRVHPTVNVSVLKPYKDGVNVFPSRPVPLNRPEPVIDSETGEEVWEVESIDGKRLYGKHKQEQYLVKWKGYAHHERTWEPIENLDGALDKVIKWTQEHNENGEPIAAKGSNTYKQQQAARKQAAKAIRRADFNRRLAQRQDTPMELEKIEDNFRFDKERKDVIGGTYKSRNTQNNSIQARSYKIHSNTTHNYADRIHTTALDAELDSVQDSSVYESAVLSPFRPFPFPLSVLFSCFVC